MCLRIPLDIGLCDGLSSQPDASLRQAFVLPHSSTLALRLLRRRQLLPLPHLLLRRLPCMHMYDRVVGRLGKMDTVHTGRAEAKSPTHLC